MYFTLFPALGHALGDTQLPHVMQFQEVCDLHKHRHPP